MSDHSLFKIPTAQLVGGTAKYGASLYVKLTPNTPIYFSVDGGVTFNATAPQPADIVVLSARMDAAEAAITVLDRDVAGIHVELSGLTARMESAETAILGATASIQGLTARVDDLELVGGTVDQRLNTIESVLSATTTTVAGLTAAVSNLQTAVIGATASIQGLTARVDALEIAGGTINDRLIIVETELAAKAPMMVYVTDTASTDVTMDLYGGTHYEFTQPLVGLTITSIQDSPYESEIIFTAGTVINVDYPSSTALVGDSFTFEANSSYIINVRDNMFIASDYIPGT